jgi:hypothetical protein
VNTRAFPLFCLIENGVYFYFKIKQERKVGISIDLESGNQEVNGNYNAFNR